MLNEKDQPQDFSKSIIELFSSFFKEYFSYKASEDELEIILLDLESRDFDSINAKMNSNGFLAKNRIAYSIMKTFYHTFDFNSLEKESKINEYLEQLTRLVSLDTEKEAFSLISLVYLSMLNSTMQVMYGISYVLIEKENEKQQEEIRIAKILKQSDGISSASQLIGGLTYVTVESKSLKNIGLASTVFGFYNEYSNKSKKELFFQSELDRINIILDKSYADLLSNLVSGAQIATRLNSVQLENKELQELALKIFDRWRICCSYVFTTNEFKGFLVKHYLLNLGDSKVKELINSRFTFIEEATDLKGDELKEFSKEYKKIKHIYRKIKIIPFLALFYCFVIIIAFSIGGVIGTISLIFLFILGGKYFEFKREHKSSWLRLYAAFDEYINQKKFYNS